MLEQQPSPDWLELILLSSENCNSRCRKRYESSPQGTMDPWVREAIVGLVEARAPRLDRLSVSHLGGESPLSSEAVYEIASAAVRIAETPGIRYCFAGFGLCSDYGNRHSCECIDVSTSVKD